MKSSRGSKRNGFTLVELLVVIVIIAALAGLSFAVLPRMMRKAKATEAMSNLRQFAPLMTTYASDHSMMLPPIKALTRMPDDTREELQWTEICLQLLNPDTELSLLRDRSWWEKTKPFLKNPLYTTWTPLKPGYAMNMMIAENIEGAKTGGDAVDPLEVSVPFASIPEPERTPLIAPGTDFYYRYDTGMELNAFKNGNAKELLVEDKIPVLFVDGHVESMTPNEYLSRQLFLMPLQPTD